MQPGRVLHQFCEGFACLWTHRPDVVGFNLRWRFRRCHAEILEPMAIMVVLACSSARPKLGISRLPLEARIDVATFGDHPDR